LKKNQHPEEAFKLKISENNLTKFDFLKELPQRARSITSDDDDDGIVIILFYLSKVIAYYVFRKLLIF